MLEKKVLHLTLMKKWFDEILSGSKKFEYREIKPYWTKRLFNLDGSVKKYDLIHFRNGYSKDARNMDVEFLGVCENIFENEKVYAIKLGKILHSSD